jgi:hypothetical protein
MKLVRNEEGGIVLEASIVLPMFLSFILMLIAFIQVSLAELALQSAVSESTKVIAVNMYPVDLLYQEARGRWDNSSANDWINQALGRIKSVKQKAIDGEEFVDEYERWIPTPIVKLMEWERTQRNELEELTHAGSEEARKKIEGVYKPLLNSAMTPVVWMYANKTRLKQERMKVTEVILPDLDHKENAFIGIEAQYDVHLSVPFFRKVIVIRKHAYEHAWVGGS